MFGDKRNPYIKLIKEYGLDLLNLESVMRWPLLWVGAIQIKIDWSINYCCNINIKIPDQKCVVFDFVIQS